MERLRMEAVRRNLVVQSVRALSPRMLRVTLGGEELAGFSSPSPDDHVKVLFPAPGGGTEARDYTPRRFDPESKTLDIDFVLHEGGAGSSWAMNARPGDVLQIGGPRGSSVVSEPAAWWLLIGDETALPSIGRRIEEATEGTEIFAMVSVSGPEEEQRFETRAGVEIHWVHRNGCASTDPTPIVRRLSEQNVPAGEGFVWIAAEANVARQVRTHVIDVMGHPVSWVKASAYWTDQAATGDLGG